MKRLTLLLATIALLLAAPASAHWKPGTHNHVHAILDAFPAQYERQALNVAYCEAGEYHWLVTKRPRDATNGQFRGMFQMGRWERATYGHGPDPWSQARAAYRYFAATGFTWGPWECKPWWKTMPRWLLAGTRLA